MEKLRRKWTIHQNYRKFQSLWAELAEITEQSDFDKDSDSVDRILDWFQALVNDYCSQQQQTSTKNAETASQHSAKYNNDTASICSSTNVSTNSSTLWTSGKEFTRVLLRIVHKFDKQMCESDATLKINLITKKALEIIETVLNDDGLKQEISESFNINLLFQWGISAAADVNSIEVKKFIIRILKMMSSNSSVKQFTASPAFRQYSGPLSSILTMILTEDSELTADIAHIFKHILQSAAESQQKQQYNDDKTNVPPSNSRKPKGLFSALLGPRITSVISELSSFIGPESALSKSCVENSSSQSLQGMIKALVDRDFPSASDIESTLSSLELRLRFKLEQQTKKRHNKVSSDCSEIRDIICDHGCLESFCAALENQNAAAVTQAAKVDMLDSIVSLLVKNPSNNCKFKLVKGYEILKRFVVNSHEENCNRVASSLLTLALDGNIDRLATNLDAVKLLVMSLKEACSVQMVKSITKHLIRLIQMNPKNSAVFIRLKTAENLICVFEQDRKLEVWRTDSILRFLNFLAVLVLNHNIFILSQYNRVLENEDCPQMSRIMESTSRLLEHIAQQNRKCLLYLPDSMTFAVFFNKSTCRQLIEKYLNILQRRPTNLWKTLLQTLKALSLTIEISGNDFQLFEECNGWAIFSDILFESCIKYLDATLEIQSARDLETFIESGLWIFRRWITKMDDKIRVEKLVDSTIFRIVQLSTIGSNFQNDDTNRTSSSAIDSGLDLTEDKHATLDREVELKLAALCLNFFSGIFNSNTEENMTVVAGITRDLLLKFPEKMVLLFSKPLDALFRRLSAKMMIDSRVELGRLILKWIESFGGFACTSRENKFLIWNQVQLEIFFDKLLKMARHGLIRLESVWILAMILSTETIGNSENPFCSLLSDNLKTELGRYSENEDFGAFKSSVVEPRALVAQNVENVLEFTSEERISKNLSTDQPVIRPQKSDFRSTQFLSQHAASFSLLILLDPDLIFNYDYQQCAKTLLELLTNNLVNKKILSADQDFILRALWMVLEVCTRNQESFAEALTVIDLIVQVCEYDISTEMAQLLLECARNPNYMYQLVDKIQNDDKKSFGTKLQVPTGDMGSLGPGLKMELERIFLKMLESITARQEPNTFFSFNGVQGFISTQPLQRFPVIRYGYTLFFWMQIAALEQDEVGFFCFENQQTGNFMEFYFRNFRKIDHYKIFNKNHGSNFLKQHQKYHLCIRYRENGSADEDYVFDQYDFSSLISRQQWHHFAITQSQKDGICLYIDGILIQTCSIHAFPKIVKGQTTIVIGKRAGRISRLDEIEHHLPVQSTGGWFSSLWATYSSCSTVMCKQDENFDQNRCGFFCGNIGSIHITEYSVDSGTIRKFFEAGPEFRKISTLISNENRLAFHIWPPAFNQVHQQNILRSASVLTKTSLKSENMEFPSDLLGKTSKLKQPSISTIDSQRLAAGRIQVADNNQKNSHSIFHLDMIQAIIDEKDGLPVRLIGTVYVGCCTHVKLTIRDALNPVGGATSCLSLFASLSTQHCSLALRIISNMLRNDQKSYQQFCLNNAWLSIQFVLSNLRNIERFEDIFGVLLEITGNGMTKDGVLCMKNVESLEIMMDLAFGMDASGQIYVMRALSELVTNNQENLAHWRTRYGISFLFEYIHGLSSEVRPYIYCIVDSLMGNLTAEETTKFFDFIVYDRRQNFEVKAQLMGLLFRHLTHNIQLVNNLKTVDALPLLVCLLDSSLENFRVAVLKIIGIILNASPKYAKTALAKIGGFDALWLFLVSAQLEYETFETLFGLAFDWYIYEEERRCKEFQIGLSIPPDICPRRRSSLGSKSDEWKVNKALSLLCMTGSGSKRLFDSNLVNVEVLKLILDLLKTTKNNRIISQVLTDFNRLLNETNIQKLWEFPWIDWITSFVVDVEMNERTSMLVSAFMQKMMVFDLHNRYSFISRNKWIPLADNENIHRMLIEAALNYFDANPCLSGVESAVDILRNLVQLYRNADDTLAFSSSLFRRFVTCINTLMYHNSSSIRLNMKSSGLFEIRDGIILRFLSADLTNHQISEFIGSFSFDLIAEQPKFRDSQSLLLILRLLHKASSDRELQMQILLILLESFLPIEANRKIIGKIIDDIVVFERLMELYRNIGTLNSAQSNPEQALGDFMDWYFGSTSPEILLKRTSIEQKLETGFMVHFSAFQAAQEKAISKRQKHKQFAKDKLLKTTAASNRILSDFRSISGQRITIAAGRHQTAVDQIRKERYERRRIGETAWADLVKELA